METTFKLRLADAPGRAFKPIDSKVAVSGYHVAYASRATLEAAEGTLYEQAFDGWQFFLRFYTVNNASKQRLVLVLDEPQVVFLYQLAGKNSLLAAGSYRALFLPKGIHPLDVEKGTHETLAFGFPYGYLVWLTRQYPKLQPLVASWKANAAQPKYLPKVRMQQEEKRTVQRLVKCPKRGNELDGALKIYLARLIALYHGRLFERILPQSAIKHTLQRVDAYLETHFPDQQAVAIPSLARRFDTSVRNLSRAYHKNHGCTIRQRLNDLRIGHAKHLLAHSDLPFETIAEQSGFRYVENFRKTFRKAVGVSPSQYRRSQDTEREKAANASEKKLNAGRKDGEQPIGSTVPL